MASIRLLALCVLCPLFLACAESPTSPSHFAPFSQTDLVVGTGAEAATGQTLRVRYTLWLYDASKTDRKGLQVETNVGGELFSFTLGQSGVIEGWNRGVPGMRVGGRRQLTVPPTLAYGDRRSGEIPANATLVFEIDLVEIVAAP